METEPISVAVSTLWKEIRGSPLEYFIANILEKVAPPETLVTGVSISPSAMMIAQVGQTSTAEHRDRDSKHLDASGANESSSSSSVPFGGIGGESFGGGSQIGAGGSQMQGRNSFFRKFKKKQNNFKHIEELCGQLNTLIQHLETKSTGAGLTLRRTNRRRSSFFGVGGKRAASAAKLAIPSLSTSSASNAEDDTTEGPRDMTELVVKNLRIIVKAYEAFCNDIGGSNVNTSSANLFSSKISLYGKGTYFLQEKLARKIVPLDSKGRLLRTNATGTHKVSSAEGIHFKFFEFPPSSLDSPTGGVTGSGSTSGRDSVGGHHVVEDAMNQDLGSLAESYPGIEHAVDSLNKLISHEGSPPTALVTLTRRGVRKIALASQTVEGESLAQALGRLQVEELQGLKKATSSSTEEGLSEEQAKKFYEFLEASFLVFEEGCLNWTVVPWLFEDMNSKSSSSVGASLNQRGMPVLQLARHPVWKDYDTSFKQLLQQKVKTAERKLREIDKKNFSIMVVLGLLTNPSDGKPDNFILGHPSSLSSMSSSEDLNRHRSESAVPTRGGPSLAGRKLVCIDNDDSFIDPILSLSFGHLPGMLNILYCFPQMEESMDEAFAEQLRQMQPEVIVRDWLKDLMRKNEEYKQMLREKIVTKKELKKLNLPIKIAAGTAINLHRKLKAIKNCLQEDKKAGRKPCSLRSLMEAVDPVVGRYYAKLKTANDTAGSPLWTIMKCYHMLFGMEKVFMEDLLQDELDKPIPSTSANVGICGSKIERDASSSALTLRQYLASVPKLRDSRGERTRTPQEAYTEWIASESFFTEEVADPTAQIFVVQGLYGESVTEVLIRQCNALNDSAVLSIIQTCPLLETLVVEECSGVTEAPLYKIAVEGLLKSRQTVLFAGCPTIGPKCKDDVERQSSGAVQVYLADSAIAGSAEGNASTKDDLLSPSSASDRVFNNGEKSSSASEEEELLAAAAEENELERRGKKLENEQKKLKKERKELNRQWHQMNVSWNQRELARQELNNALQSKEIRMVELQKQVLWKEGERMATILQIYEVGLGKEVVGSIKIRDDPPAGSSKGKLGDTYVREMCHIFEPDVDQKKRLEQEKKDKEAKLTDLRSKIAEIDGALEKVREEIAVLEKAVLEHKQKKVEFAQRTQSLEAEYASMVTRLEARESSIETRERELFLESLSLEEKRLSVLRAREERLLRKKEELEKEQQKLQQMQEELEREKARILQEKEEMEKQKEELREKQTRLELLSKEKNEKNEKEVAELKQWIKTMEAEKAKKEERAKRERKKLKQLQQQFDDKQRQLEALEKDLKEQEARLQQSMTREDSTVACNAEVASLRSKLANTEKQLRKAQEQRRRLEKEKKRLTKAPPTAPQPQPVVQDSAELLGLLSEKTAHMLIQGMVPKDHKFSHNKSLTHEKAVLPIILSVMKREACSALWKLMVDNPEGKAALIQRGAIETFVLAHENHANSETVIFKAAGALLHLLKHTSIKNKDAVSSGEILALSGVENGSSGEQQTDREELTKRLVRALLNNLEIHITNESIASCCVESLHLLVTKTGSRSEKVRTLLAEKRVVRLLKTALDKHKTEQDLLTKATSLIGILTVKKKSGERSSSASSATGENGSAGSSGGIARTKSRKRLSRRIREEELINANKTEKEG
ncbi:hypothetical protein QOT17_025112 [Balamuthia mandrillaris]